jgi:flagellar basal-body rod protein FlgB
VNLPDIPLLVMLKERMVWLGQRQRVLSENVANADTPGYAARDLKPLDFAQALKAATAQPASSIALATTNPRHIALVHGGVGRFDDDKSPDTAADPTGNSVSLEQQMIKVADTQAQFQAATNLYAKALELMRTAIGKTSS